MDGGLDTGAAAPTATDLKGRILKLLVMGVRPSEIADSCGCEPSYISQLIKTPEFIAVLQEKGTGRLEKEADLKERYETLEGKVLEKLERAVDWVAKPMELVRILQILGARKHAAVIPTGREERETATISLSGNSIKIFAPQFVINERNDVVGLGDQSFAPMSSGALIAYGKEARIKELENGREVEAASRSFAGESRENGGEALSEAGSASQEKSRGNPRNFFLNEARESTTELVKRAVDF